MAKQETVERCPTCGATVEVHHGLEGTSHYRPSSEVEAVAREMREYAYSKPDNSDAFRVTLDRVEGWADRLDAARKER